jgi:fatty acid desaturase
MPQDNPFPLVQAREIVKDLLIPRHWIYWTDFLFHMALGWSAFVATLKAPPLSLWQLLFYLITALALYRAAIFTHELAHKRKDTFWFFRLVWNLSCGIPLMMPSFTYRAVHNDHHKRNVYGSRGDGEYLPFAVDHPHKIILYLLLNFVLPLGLAGRFIVLTPISYLNKAWRRLVWERASSLTIDFRYRRPQPSSRDERTWRLQEISAFLSGAMVIALLIAGILPYQVLVVWYSVAVLVFLLNSLRTLAAHCYRNPGNQRMSFSEQYLDSVNVPGNPVLTPLWAPVGLRYHATHHLFPTLPYHGLGEAHRRLVRELPDNTLYLQTTRKGLWDALRRLWQDSRRVGLPPQGVLIRQQTASQ